MARARNTVQVPHPCEAHFNALILHSARFGNKMWQMDVFNLPEDLFLCVWSQAPRYRVTVWGRVLGAGVTLKHRDGAWIQITAFSVESFSVWGLLQELQDWGFPRLPHQPLALLTNTSLSSCWQESPCYSVLGSACHPWRVSSAGLRPEPSSSAPWLLWSSRPNGAGWR